jgi:hypothetical protein
MSASPTAAGRGGWSSPLALAGCIALAAAFSVLRKGYQFDGIFADDQFWNALLKERLDPGLLAGDPLVELLADRYASGLFDAVVLLAPLAELPAIAIALFAIARLGTCWGIFALTRTLTGSAASGVTSTFLAAGAWIAYFGGVNFVETILTPRGFALPFALFALDAWLREVAFPSRGSRRAFGAGCLLLVAEGLWIALRTGALQGDGSGLRFDPAWAEVIAATVGPWVYLHQLPAGIAVACGWGLVFGAVGVVATGTPVLRYAAVRVAAAACVALALHFIAVDLLNLRFLLQISPQRASLAMAAVAVVALGHWTAESIRDRDPVRRALGIAFFLSAVLVADLSVAIVFAGLLSLAWWPPAARLLPRLRSVLATALVVSVAVLGWPTIRSSFHLQPARVAPHLARLRALGVDEDWASAQRYIRRHSQRGDVVMAPPALSPRVFAERPSTLRMKMQSFTYISRPYAFAFDAWRRDVGIPLQTADTHEALALARRGVARWLVLDDRDTPALPRDPRPDFRAGPYRAFALSAQPPPPAPDASPMRSPNLTR